MKIQVVETGMNIPTPTPDTQQMVVDFNGTFEEYKASERRAIEAPIKDIEIMGISEEGDGTLIVDYIAVRMNRKWIRQTHRPA